MLGLAARAEPVVRLFTTEDGLVRNWVTRIRLDSQGRLWFCTVEGLSLFDGQRFANYGTQHGLPHRIVNDIVEAGDGTYWLATQAGLYRFRPRIRAGGAVIRSRSATWRTGSPEGVGPAQDRRRRGLEWHRGRAFPGRNRRAAAWAPSPACDSFTARWRLSQHLVAGRKP